MILYITRNVTINKFEVSFCTLLSESCQLECVRHSLVWSRRHPQPSRRHPYCFRSPYCIPKWSTGKSVSHSMIQQFKSNQINPDHPALYGMWRTRFDDVGVRGRERERQIERERETGGSTRPLPSTRPYTRLWWGDVTAEEGKWNRVAMNTVPPISHRARVLHSKVVDREERQPFDDPVSQFKPNH